MEISKNSRLTDHNNNVVSSGVDRKGKSIIAMDVNVERHLTYVSIVTLFATDSTIIWSEVLENQTSLALQDF